MKLIYIINAKLPNKMAHGYHVIKMCESFARSGADVTLLLPHKPNKIKEDIFTYYNVDKSFKVPYCGIISFELNKEYNLPLFV